MIDTVDALAEGATLAELQGIPQEIGDAIACLAEAELEAGRVEIARAILEGLVVTNHEDAGAWALLSQAHRRLAQPLAARFCAEVAAKLAPGDRFVRLARAESLLAVPDGRTEARAELVSLAAEDEIGVRAQALLTALGNDPKGLQKASARLDPDGVGQASLRRP
jgi:predicted Zn-dependent protease